MSNAERIFYELPSDWVDLELRQRAEQVLIAACSELDLGEPRPAIRWFSASIGDPTGWPHGKTFRGQRDLAGQHDPADPDSIWISADWAWPTISMSVRHEAAHVRDWRRGWWGFTEEQRAHNEARAEAFGLGRSLKGDTSHVQAAE